MVKYFLEYYQDGSYSGKINLKIEDKKHLHHSYSYYGSSTRAGSPVVCLNINENILYKTFGFRLKCFNENTSTENIICDTIIIDEIVKDNFECATLAPSPLFPKIKTNIINFGDVTFGIRQLHRWEGMPYEISSCRIEMK